MTSKHAPHQEALQEKDDKERHPNDAPKKTEKEAADAWHEDDNAQHPGGG